MNKKQDVKKKKRVESDLTPEESVELQMILDRLLVQDPEGGSIESYLQSLRNMLSGRENLLIALVEELCKNPTKVGFRIFLMARDIIDSKQTRRIMKQAAYRFSQRGFVAHSEDASDDVVVLIQKEARKPLAHMMIGQGTLWFVSALMPEEGHRAPTTVAAFFDRDFQQLRVRVTESSARLYKEFIQKMGRSLPLGKPCEIPIWHAARLFFELLEFSKGPQTPTDLDDPRALFRPFQDPERLPYAYELMPQLEHPQQRINEINVKAVFEHMDITWLYLPKDELFPFYQKLEELDHSPLVIPEEVKVERWSEIIRKAADTLCAGKTRFLYERFFEEQALWWKLIGRDSQALEAWIVAQHLRSPAIAGENPVVFQMVVSSLHHHWPSPEESKEDEYQGDPYYRSESGLILPR